MDLIDWWRRTAATLVKTKVINVMNMARRGHELPDVAKSCDVFHRVVTVQQRSLLTIKSSEISVELRNNDLYAMIVIYCNDVLQQLQHVDCICISSVSSRSPADIPCAEMLIVTCMVDQMVRVIFLKF